MKTIATVLVSVLLACACSAPSKSKNDAPAGGPSDVGAPGNGDNGATAGDPPAGDNTPTGTTTPDAGTPAPETLDSCIAGCESKYPKAAGQNKQLDASCMLGGACESVCNGLVAGKNFPPDAVDGSTCDTVGANSYPILTPSAACSTCLATTPACCALWISIFGSVEGQNLNTCATACYSKFPAK